VELSGEDLSHYSTKIESVGLRGRGRDNVRTCRAVDSPISLLKATHLGQNWCGVDADWVYEMGLWGYTLSSPGEYD